jgi:hypothetical protein
MAFNPFRSFRRNQKYWMAGILIVCMITFVLCSGFSMGENIVFQVMSWFGWGGRRGDLPVASLYGRPVYYSELADLQRQRLLAHQFISAATTASSTTVVQRLFLSLDKVGGFKDTLQNILQRVGTFRQFAAVLGPDYAREYLQLIPAYQSQLGAIRRALADTQKLEEAELVRDLMTVLNQDLRLYQRPRDTYFGGSLGVPDLLDFLIWRRQADDLGIQLSDDAVRAAVQRETLGRLSRDDSRAIEKGLLQQNRTLRPADLSSLLLKALGDEFRVRMAQAALLGYEPGDLAHVPAPVTPHEFWQFFRDKRTEIHVSLLPLPVGHPDFLQAVGLPPEAELKELFEKHKDRESTPDDPVPGFKEPRRVQVEYVTARADSPHYRQAAVRMAPVLQAARQVLGGSLSAVPGDPVATPAAGAALPLLSDLALATTYESIKFSEFRNPSWTEPWLFPPYLLHDASRHRAENVALAVGQALAAAGTPAAPLAPLTAFESAAIVHDLRYRLRRGLTAWLGVAGSSATPWGMAALAAHHFGAPKEEYKPLASVQDRVVEKLHEDLAHSLVVANLNALKKDLETHAREKGSDPKGLAGLLEKATAAYDLVRRSTDQPRDRYALASDPQLQPLKEAYRRSREGFQDRKARNFANLFLGDTKLYVPKQLPDSPFLWQTDMGRPGEELFLYWIKDNQEARVPTFAEAKAKVEAAWRFDRARALAKKKAEEVAAAARKTKGDAARALTDVPPFSEKVFGLGPVAELLPTPVATANPNVPIGYGPYRLPEDKEDQLEYPPPDLVKRLLALKDRSDVVLFPDRPEATYYVAALVARFEKSEKDFYQTYKNASPSAAFHQDYLLFHLEHERREQYHKDFLEYLRNAAKLSIDEENRKVFEERGRLGEE